MSSSGILDFRKVLCVITPLKKTDVTMDVSFFDEVPFYPQPDLSSSPSLPSYPAQSSTRTSTYSRPFFTSCSIQSCPKFTDPPVVYTHRPKDNSITYPGPSSLVAPETGMTPYTSTVLVHSSSQLSAPTDPIKALLDPRWKQAMEEEIVALN